MRTRVFLPLILVVVTLAWVGSASAFFISVIEPDDPTVNIGLNQDIFRHEAGTTIILTPEFAFLSGTINSVALPALSASVGLTEPGTGTLSDLLTVDLAPNLCGAPPCTQLTVSFQSDSETPLTGSPLLTLVETGLPQVAFSTSLGPLGSLTITTQSDLDLAPVPEPVTLLLLGTTMAGLGLARWRRRRQK